MQRGTLLGALFAMLATGQAAQDYLKEKPSFLTPCHIHAPVEESCIKVAFESLFTNWRNGVPGLKHLGSVDPFHVKRVQLSQRSENLADIHVDMQNVVTRGLSATKVLKASIDEKNYVFSLQLFTPSVKLEGDYKLKGRLLVLNLDGKGTLKIEMSDYAFSVVVKANLIKVGDEDFFDVISASSKIDKIGNFKISLTNLFNGNKELEDSANAVFNENWRDLFEVMRPALTQTMDAMLLDRYKRIFAYIPARYFVDDLP